MGSLLKNLAASPPVQVMAANAALGFAPRLTWGNTLVLSRWNDIREALSRDLDFVIEPVNKERIERVNGPFILGLDRSGTHLHERDVLYKALSPEDLPRLHDLACSHIKAFLDQTPKGSTIDVVNGYARRTASRNATALTGVEGPDEENQMRVARALFHELFLNLGGDEKVRDTAIAASKELQLWVSENIAAKRKNKKGGTDMISRLIALDLEDDLIRRTVSGMFVGAIDTTATCVAQIMAIILKRPTMRTQMMKDLDNPVRMRGWCYEALRFWPHNPIVLRQAARDCTLGNLEIKAGTTIVCFTLAAMHDPAAFPAPETADPARPVERYMHFGGGLHPCAGRAVNGMQIPLLVTELLRRAPVQKSKIEHDGPFPDKLIIEFQS